MRKKGAVLLFIISVFFSSVVLTHADDHELEKIREAIKSSGAKWQAGETSISQLPPDGRRALLGGLKEEVSPDEILKTSSGVALPSHFDWRDHNGYNWMTPIKGQPCSNCWAYAAVGAFEAMIKIESNRPNTTPDMSERFVTWCGKGECTGWWMGATLEVLKNMGVPDEACLTVSHCVDTCENRFFRSAFVSSWGYVNPVPADMKDMIYNNGPVTTWMMIYTDFYNYTGGVYQHVYGPEEGGHFVVICGWDDTESYWICRNSWGTNWGESGWFRIRMGVNEAGIETEVHRQNVDMSSIAERMVVTAPNSWAQFMGEDNTNVRWASPFFYDTVEIEYSTNSGSDWLTIQANTTNDGEYNWTIPETASSNCRVRVSDAADGVPSDQSDNDFMIYIVGDANADTNRDIVDIVYLINYVLKTGPEPIPLRAGDAFCDYDINLQDIVFMVNYVLKGGPKPTCFW